MKKHYLFTLFATMLLLAGCDYNEDNFEGFDEITISDVPTEWQEEIQRRVEERIAAEGEAAEQDISAEEALDILLGGEV